MKYDKKKFKMFVNSSAVFFLLTLTDVFRSYIFSKSSAVRVSSCHLFESL